MMSYGYDVDGFSTKVLNEREARAAAGILFLFGILSFLNSFMLGHFVFTQYFVGIFMFDFFIRILNPKYAPSLLAGRFFVQNQTPEYVGATQKRFAWSIGFVLSAFMFYFVVIEPQMTLFKIVICVICLMLLFFESAFSICIGCKLYSLIMQKSSLYCPGESCELKNREPIVAFSKLQKIILAAFVLLVVAALYIFSVKTPNYSFAMEMIPMMLE